jgi:hypothetical protein
MHSPAKRTRVAWGGKSASRAPAPNTINERIAAYKTGPLRALGQARRARHSQVIFLWLSTHPWDHSRELHHLEAYDR